MCSQQARFDGHSGTSLARFALAPIASSRMTLIQILTSHDLTHGQAKLGTSAPNVSNVLTEDQNLLKEMQLCT
jgi:hypothetical protein